jgi:hypothetical protein
MSERGKISPIGDLAKRIVSKLEVSDMTTPGLTEKPNATATTAGRRGALSKIPMPALGTGSTALPSLIEAVGSAEPRLVDRSLIASLPLRLRPLLAEKWEHLSTEEYGWDGVFLRYDWSEDPDAADARQALATIAPALAPASPAELISALTRVRLTTISRNIGADDWRLTLAAYADGLSQYPRDCALKAIKLWGESEKFWPALVELRALAERMARRRNSLKRLLLESVS